jgi:hypothetical protein
MEDGIKVGVVAMENFIYLVSFIGYFIDAY